MVFMVMSLFDLLLMKQESEIVVHSYFLDRKLETKNLEKTKT